MIGLAEQRWRQVTYGGPATLRTGTIQDPNWKVKRVQGFVPEISAQLCMATFPPHSHDC